MPMTPAQQRALALAAARYQLRQFHCDPLECTAADAHQALDDYARRYRAMAAAQWYYNADDAQLRLFYQDWQRWQCKQQALFGLDGRYRAGQKER